MNDTSIKNCVHCMQPIRRIIDHDPMCLHLDALRERWSSKRVRVEDLSKEPGYGSCVARGTSGYRYPGGYCIEDLGDRFYLILYRDEWIAEDLSKLEKKLWDFALDQTLGEIDGLEEG